MKERFFAGIDVGGTFTKIALMDERCRLVAKDKISSQNFSDKTHFRKTVKESLMRLLARKNISFARIGGVGIGVPGPVDAGRGVVMSLTNIRGWNHFPLARCLKRELGVPVFADNDANCMALAEVRQGAARGASCALCVTLGTGVGGGLILGRDIYRSPFFLTGEIGHIPLKADGPRCACGGTGCLERYVGNRAIQARVRKIFKKDISLEEASFLARRGQTQARRLWQDVGRDIGLALAGVVNVLNPEVIIVGGGVAQAGPVLLDAVRRTVRRHAMKQLKKIQIRLAALGADAGVWGAALLAKENIEAGC